MEAAVLEMETGQCAVVGVRVPDEVRPQRRERELPEDMEHRQESGYLRRTREPASAPRAAGSDTE